VIEVRRPSDGELCGFVCPADDGAWQSLTVFGAVLVQHSSQRQAEDHVLEHGLAVLAEHWWYRADAGAEWQIACIVEARPGEVRLALDYYPMPGVPILTVGPQQFAAGAEVRREPVGAPEAE
jgi:hypothetical protein